MFEDVRFFRHEEHISKRIDDLDDNILNLPKIWLFIHYLNSTQCVYKQQESDINSKHFRPILLFELKGKGDPKYLEKEEATKI